ncbi:hypothetical protein Shyd_82800 [Streptomyces hydrogenans]|uniref:Uncharacterized protein n=1 Tax=Streptomyces hydrogenans TaxID=1873719 RepID=A0ABQ3PPG3_9ACTN|nr:hypothetical protein GCM10018784_70700 [Streptomyces hydrogenans]GHI24551.1 hypothetical protein Shyd_59220 [Streptomyces hydrogenans]GHI25901.1 hypothetical protein Shyd_72720 [Streptomyces hydrogenans]GHI26882.1 hypothetical protein Shyd_82530 [Streptomyces hydrogenans]GHI26909.1 hypothetical protein Shyd_82800 [Streptomyces hydrogenans]
MGAGAGVGAVSGEAGLAAPLAASALPGASGRPCKARTRAPGTCSLAAEISFGAIQLAFVRYAGASGFAGDAPADRLGRADGVGYGR